MSWKKKIAWTVVVMLGISILLVGTAYVVVHTKAFNRWVLSNVIQGVQKSIGGRVEIQSVAIDWRKLDVDLYGIVLYGVGAKPAPFFEADHLQIGVKVISLIRRKFDLAEMILDRPQLHLVVDAQGNSNFPHPAEKQQSSNAADTIFDLKIGHTAVNSGELFYNDEKVPLEAELHNFHAEINYRLLFSEYKGSLGYENGRIRVKDFNPIEHSTLAQFTANRTGMAMEQLLITTGKSHITVNGQLSDYARPSIDGKYEGVVFTEELASILKNSSIPIGQATTEGTFQYRDVPGQPFFDGVYVDGQAGSLQLWMRKGRISAPIKSVQAEYLLKGGNLHVENLRAAVLQGRLVANMEMLHVTGSAESRLDATLQGISLSQINDALPPGKYKRIRLVGTAKADTRLTWSGNARDLVVRTHAAISSGTRQTEAGSAIPVNGNIDLKYDRAHDSASLGQSFVRTSNTQISLSGIASKQSDLSIQAHTSDLYEVAVLVDKIQSAVGSSPETSSEPYDVHGSAQFDGQVHGPVTAPELRGQLTASELRVDGSQWRSLQAAIELSPARVAVQNGSLANSKQGQVSFSGSAGLGKWALTPTSSVSLHATATNLSVADFERLANEKYPVTGILTANVAIDGSLQSPMGQGTIQLTRASAWSEPFRNLSVKFEGTNNGIHSRAELQTLAGAVSADLTYSPSTQEYAATIRTSGLKIDQLNAVKAHELGISGMVSASGSGHGTVKNPEFSMTFDAPEMNMRGQAISQARGQVMVASDHANFSLNAVVAQGTMEAKGDVGIHGEYQAMASVDMRSLPIGPLVASYVSGSVTGLEGQTDIHATLSGPLKEPGQLTVHLQVPALKLQYRTAEIALVRPLDVDYRNGVASVQPTELKGNGTDLTFQGEVPIENVSQSNIKANGTVDLALLQGFTNGVRSSGQINLNLSANGFSTGAVRGDLRIVNATLTTDTIPVGFEGINGQIQITGDRLDIRQFAGKAGGGEINAGGFLIYGARSNFNLNLGAQNVRVRYPEGLRSVLSGDLRLMGTATDSTLSGRAILEKLSFTQQFDLSSFVGQFGSTLPSGASSFQQNMKLNVALQSADQLNLASSKVSMAGAANLTLSGTLADPIVLGRLTLTGGEVFFLGKRYEVQSGTIEFANPVMTQPVLNLYVTTTVQQYDITLNFTGPVDRMRTNYTSTPPLPPADIINLIALGQTAEESAASSTPASLGAESVLAQGVGGQVSGKLEQLAGISQLTLDPMAGNNQSNPGAQVGIQQRVTGNLLVTFSTDVNSAQATTVQVQYRTSPATSVSVVRDQNGGYALTLRLHKTF